MEFSPSFAADARIRHTAELRHDLFKIEYLLTTLGNAPSDAAAPAYDLVWLRDRRRYLTSILAKRRALQKGKIVDLAAWRRTAAGPDKDLADVA